jgi:hypothetical protein
MMTKNRVRNVSGKRKAVVGALALVGWLGGCSDEPASGPAAIEDVGPLGVSPGAKAEVLADVDVGYGRVVFHKLETADGYTLVSVSESAPNTYRETPFSKLTMIGATHLELFRALQPEVTPPAVLNGLHPIEAEAMGRVSTEVRDLTFDRDAPIEKSVASCEAWVYEDPPDTCGARFWTNGRWANNLSGELGLHVGQFWDYKTLNNVTLGICNESPNKNIFGRVGVDYGNDTSTTYTYGGWATVQPAHAWRWWDFRDVRCTKCSGGICTLTQPCAYASRYRVDGSSGPGVLYHLRTAEANKKCDNW